MKIFNKNNKKMYTSSEKGVMGAVGGPLEILLTVPLKVGNEKLVICNLQILFDNKV